ncbi:MAG: hypothetical protein J5803_05735, partial [Desulfovibrio sp.]|nr:hypothetical protein [Desulfovibrio sp.]
MMLQSMRYLCVSLLFIFLAAVLTGESCRGEEQVPVLTRDGGMNLTHEWMEGGGARLYWRS